MRKVEIIAFAQQSDKLFVIMSFYKNMQPVLLKLLLGIALGFAISELGPGKFNSTKIPSAIITAQVITEESSQSQNADSNTKLSMTCGNGILEIGENCDDGNLLDEDGCSSLCQSEYPTQRTLTSKIHGLMAYQIEEEKLSNNTGPISLFFITAGTTGGIGFVRRKKRS